MSYATLGFPYLPEAVASLPEADAPLRRKDAPLPKADVPMPEADAPFPGAVLLTATIPITMIHTATDGCQVSLSGMQPSVEIVGVHRRPRAI